MNKHRKKKEKLLKACFRDGFVLQAREYKNKIEASKIAAAGESEKLIRLAGYEC